MIRLRRLRNNETVRNMIRETSVSVNDLVYPVFIKEGTDEKIPVDSMPGIYQYTIDRFPEELDRIQKAGVSAILIFGIPEHKDECGSQAYAEDGITQRAIRQIKEWAPLVMEGRDPQQKVAATRTEIGTDVNYGEITRQLIASLQKKSNFSLQLSSEVRALKRNDDNTWTVTVADLKNGTAQNIRAKFVFIGAGGAALKLLQESGIPEAKDYAGFPVGGQFLVSENPDVVNHHLAKVYGKASVGAPPMSVPHIDTRVLDGKRVVLFGPFATFSTKFLKNGSLWDLMSSTTTSNVMPMMHVGLDNFDLVKYLVSQVMLSEEDRFEALKEYYPQAKKEDWRLWQAGQRVQIIKRDADKGGVLRLGTEVVSDQQGTIAALLGASPGASTAAPIMLDLLEKVFGDRVSSPQWQATLKAIVPSYGRKLNGDVAATERELQYTSEVLGLKYDKPQVADSTPKPQLKPQPVQKEVADIAL